MNQRILYHYTNREGLLGIISSQELWATDINYLNDSSEFKYAKDILYDEVSIIGASEPKDKRSFFENFLNRIYYFHPNLFCFSLSKNDDQLSQWRAYCQPNNGYSIGFNVNKLLNMINKFDGAKLSEVDYDSSNHSLKIKKIVSSTLSKKNIDDDKIIDDILNEFISYAPYIKHQTFSEEDEFRIIFILSDILMKEIRFRTGKSFLIPYYPIVFNKPDILPIEEIVIGPSPHPELERESLNKLFDKFDLSVNIKNSLIPFRSW